MKPQIFKTDLGEELVILTRREYDAIRARAGDEDAEDAMTEQLVAEARRDLAEGRDVVLPDWFCDAAMKGNGSVLRGLRQYRGLTQDQVAEAGQISQVHYSEVERGRKPPTLDVLDRISDALELDRSWMRALERNRVVGAG